MFQHLSLLVTYSDREIDLSYIYEEQPFSPAEGRKGENRQFLTTALFLETNTDRKYPPVFSLSDVDVLEDGVLYVSARLIYIHSDGEHDAMLKLVGSFRQWERLKELGWFAKELESWQAEWSMRKVDEARRLLKVHALVNPSSAKALFDDAKKRTTVGRPRKKRVAERDEDDVTDDASRVVSIR